MLRNRRSEYLVAAVLVAPFVLIFGWMFIYPTLQMIQISFTKSPLIGEGVWIGCELEPQWQGKAMDVVKAAGEHGLLLLVAGPDVVRIAPSLLISLDDILEGLGRLEQATNAALR